MLCKNPSPPSEKGTTSPEPIPLFKANPASDEDMLPLKESVIRRYCIITHLFPIIITENEHFVNTDIYKYSIIIKKVTINVLIDFFFSMQYNIFIIKKGEKAL